MKSTFARLFLYRLLVTLKINVRYKEGQLPIRPISTVSIFFGAGAVPHGKDSWATVAETGAGAAVIDRMN